MRNQVFKRAIKRLVYVFFSFSLIFVQVSANESDYTDRMSEEDNVVIENFDIFDILSKYNAFSFDKITGSHVVGPVIGKGFVGKVNVDSNLIDYDKPLNDAVTHRLSSDDNLTVGDITMGIPSYIADDNRASGFNGDMRKSLNIHDLNGDVYYGGDNVIESSNEESSKISRSPIENSHTVSVGTLAKYSNDFIDWNAAQKELSRQSIDLISLGTKIISEEDIVILDDVRYLFVEQDDIVNVPVELDFDRIAIIVSKEDRENVKFYDLGTTIINYLGDKDFREKPVYLSSSKIDIGFPLTGHGLISGIVKFIPQYGGEHLAYSDGTRLESKIDSGINLIHNYPEAKKLFFNTENNDSFGHYVAVNAELYKETGNINGHVIAKNIISKGTEYHYYPFNGEVPNVDLNEKISFNVEKVWNGMAMNEISFELLANGISIDTFSLSQENNWSILIDNLDKYDDNDVKISYTIVEKEVPGYRSNILGNTEDGFVILNSELINFEVDKIWIGDSLTEIEVDLYQNGIHIDTQKLSSPNWNTVFSDLDKYDEDGELYNYHVVEKKYNGYDVSYISDDYSTTITNSLITKHVEINKTWLGSSLDKVEFEIYANGVFLKNFEMTEATNWSYIEELPFYDSNGNEIIYTVEELVPEGYDSSSNVNNNTFNFTNRDISVIDIPVEKYWIGTPLDSIQVNLICNDLIIQTLELNNGNNWKSTFEKLRVYDDFGEKIEYTVEEMYYEGYTSTVEVIDNIFVITNTEKEEVPVDPDIPVDPEVPVDPVDPEEPIDPEVPVDPEVPTEPEIPVTPEEPDTPLDPEVPVIPELPPYKPEVIPPTGPTEPVLPMENVPGVIGKPVEPNIDQSTNKDKIDTLPATGVSSKMLTGLVLLIFGSIIIRRKD